MGGDVAIVPDATTNLAATGTDVGACNRNRREPRLAGVVLHAAPLAEREHELGMLERLLAQARRGAGTEDAEPAFSALHGLYWLTANLALARPAEATSAGGAELECELHIVTSSPEGSMPGLQRRSR